MGSFQRPAVAMDYDMAIYTGIEDKLLLSEVEIGLCTEKLQKHIHAGSVQQEIEACGFFVNMFCQKECSTKGIVLRKGFSRTDHS